MSLTQRVSARPRAAFTAAIVLLLVGAAAVRIWAARGELWLDEIWSMVLYTNRFTSAWQIFSEIHHDTNHHLVSLWMYLCRGQRAWWIYRVPSLVAGTATVGLAAWVARQWGTWESITAAVLTASSFFLISYASEARGYALAGFFALGALVAMQQYLAGRGWLVNVIFCTSCVLGFLSHLTFLFFYISVFLWSLVGLLRERPAVAGIVVDLARCFLIPTLFLLGLYYIDLREIRVGGAPESGVASVLQQTLALTIGGWELPGNFQAVAALAALAIMLAGIVSLYTQRNDLWIFFAAMIFVVPATVLPLTSFEQLMPRYFYLPMLFGLILASSLLGRLARLGRTGQVAAVVVTLVFVALNARDTYGLLKFGRGHYLEAVEYMAEHSREPAIRVTSDHHFRNFVVLVYYAHYLGSPKEFQYDDAPKETPCEWLIVHSMQQDFRPADIAYSTDGTAYRLAAAFPYAGLSGYHWALYHRLTAESARH